MAAFDRFHCNSNSKNSVKEITNFVKGLCKICYFPLILMVGKEFEFCSVCFDVRIIRKITILE